MRTPEFDIELEPFDLDIEVEVLGGAGASSYAELRDKPSINGVTLEAGDNELNFIEDIEEGYNDPPVVRDGNKILLNIPSINELEQVSPFDGFIAEIAHYYQKNGNNTLTLIPVPAEYKPTAQEGTVNRGNHAFIPYSYFNRVISDIESRLDALVDGDSEEY